MTNMDQLKAQVETLWEDFRKKTQTAEDAKIHHGYARLMIEASRVEIAERKLRLLTAVDVTPAAIAHAKGGKANGNSAKRIAR